MNARKCGENNTLANHQMVTTLTKLKLESLRQEMIRGRGKEAESNSKNHSGKQPKIQNGTDTKGTYSKPSKQLFPLRCLLSYIFSRGWRIQNQVFLKQDWKKNQQSECWFLTHLFPLRYLQCCAALLIIQGSVSVI